MKLHVPLSIGFNMLLLSCYDFVIMTLVLCIKFYYLDTQCVTLALSDGLKILCDSTFTNGVGYIGDTCSFTCNTGYEFSGGETRTCQSDGSWSGVEAICTKGVYYVGNMCGGYYNLIQL